MSNANISVSRLHYDALSRWMAVTIDDLPPLQRFYQQRHRLATQLQDGQRYSFLQHGERLFAQLQTDARDGRAALMATNAQQSPLATLRAETLQANRYSPYGHSSLPVPPHAPGFNGELAEPLTRQHLLGSYRLYNSTLMRFTQPDNWSPFGKGGLNAYAYCSGDPINRLDPTGHNPLLKVLKFLKITKKAPSKAASSTQAKPLNIAQDMKEIYPGVTQFVDKGGKRLNIRGHGRPVNGKPTVLMTDTRQAKDGYEVGIDLMNDPDLSLKEITKVRTLVCHSAEGGEFSFAASLAETLNIPTKGFHGRVGTQESTFAIRSGPNGQHEQIVSVFNYYDDVSPHISEVFHPMQQSRP